MDMNEILQTGAQAFKDSPSTGDVGSGLDIGTLTSALEGLSGDNAGLDISSLVQGMREKGMGDMLQSWLGDGGNQAISGEAIGSILDSDRLSAFASQLGLTKEQAIGGLQDAMPRMFDQASSGGSLLDSVGGVSGVIGLIRGLFAR